jgi:hypothetical protein
VGNITDRRVTNQPIAKSYFTFFDVMKLLEMLKRNDFVFWLGIVYANKCESSLAQIAVVCVYVCRGFNTAEQLFLPIISFRFDSRVNRHESSKRLYRLKIGEI